MRNPNDSKPDFEERWREWSQTEPAIDERQLRRNLLDRIPSARSQVRPRVVLAAAAASLLAVLISFEATRHRVVPPVALDQPVVVYDTGENVILVLREGGEPIYVLTGSPESPGGNR